MYDEDERPGRDALFRTLPGGSEIADWFGVVPSFHDATIEHLVLADRSVTMTIRAFRMTREIDAKGYFVTDRHARVTATALRA